MKGTANMLGDHQLRQDTVSWAREAEGYIESGPDAIKVVVQFVGGRHPIMEAVTKATGLDIATVTPIIGRLVSLGVIARLSDGGYGTTFRGEPFLENRAHRWKRQIEEMPIREELAGKTHEELMVDLGATSLALKLGTLTDKEIHEHHVRVRVVRELLK